MIILKKCSGLKQSIKSEKWGVIMKPRRKSLALDFLPGSSFYFFFNIGNIRLMSASVG